MDCDELESFYEDLSDFHRTHNKLWNERNEKLYKSKKFDKITDYKTYLDYYADEYFDYSYDPRYIRKVIVVKDETDICDLL